MKRKIFLSLLLILIAFTITGCDKVINKTKSKNKVYECRYNKDDNAEGKRYLTKHIIELNDKNEAEVYRVIAGFTNYGSETEGYTEFCNGLKNNKQNDLLEKYKGSVDLKVVCNKENNYQAYILKEYKIKKIKDISDFSTIYKFLEPYIKEDGTFDLDGWKNYFNTDSLKAGNYSCDF